MTSINLSDDKGYYICHVVELSAGNICVTTCAAIINMVMEEARGFVPKRIRTLRPKRIRTQALDDSYPNELEDSYPQRKKTDALLD